LGTLALKGLRDKYGCKPATRNRSRICRRPFRHRGKQGPWTGPTQARSIPLLKPYALETSPE